MIPMMRARDVTSSQLQRVRASGDPFWLDIDSSDATQRAFLSETFDFHPLAIEDTLNPRTRVKVEEYDGYLFIVLRALRFEKGRPLDWHELGVETLCLFLASDFLISVHVRPSGSIEQTARRLADAPGAHIDPARVAHAIGDVIVDGYFPIRDEIDSFVDRLERTDELKGRALREILGARRLAFAARRSLTPQREIFERLAHTPSAFVSADARLYFRDVYDHAQRIIDSFDAYGELIADTTDSHLAEVSIRLDYATTALSAAATVAIPFLVISGLYGMNFPWMPFLHDPHGFWIVVSIQIGTGGLLLAILRRRGLI